MPPTYFRTEPSRMSRRSWTLCLMKKWSRWTAGGTPSPTGRTRRRTARSTTTTSTRFWSWRRRRPTWESTRAATALGNTRHAPSWALSWSRLSTTASSITSRTCGMTISSQSTPLSRWENTFLIKTNASCWVCGSVETRVCDVLWPFVAAQRVDSQNAAFYTQSWTEVKQREQGWTFLMMLRVKVFVAVIVSWQTQHVCSVGQLCQLSSSL